MSLKYVMLHPPQVHQSPTHFSWEESSQELSTGEMPAKIRTTQLMVGSSRGTWSFVIFMYLYLCGFLLFLFRFSCKFTEKTHSGRWTLWIKALHNYWCVQWSSSAVSSGGTACFIWSPFIACQCGGMACLCKLLSEHVFLGHFLHNFSLTCQLTKKPCTLCHMLKLHKEVLINP